MGQFFSYNVVKIYICYFSFTILNANNYNCNSFGPSDTCILSCDGTQSQGPFYCGEAGDCQFQCSGDYCAEYATIYGDNAHSLTITVLDDSFSCLSSATIIAPHSGNLYLNQIGFQSLLSYDSITVEASSSTKYIIIHCNLDCVEMQINATTASYLEIIVGFNVGFRGSGWLSTIYCPVDSNYNGTENAPCILDVSAEGAFISNTEIYTKYGIPRDLWIKQYNDSERFRYSELFCDAYNTSAKDISPKPNACWRTSSPTIHPSFVTIDPSIAPTANPTKLSNHPTRNPSIVPTLNPSANPSIVPTLNPSSNPSAVPTLNPSANPITSTTTNHSANPTLTTLNTSANPSTAPTSNPSANPSSSPTLYPTQEVTMNPTVIPTNPNTSITEMTTIKPSTNPIIDTTFTVIDSNAVMTNDPIVESTLSPSTSYASTVPPSDKRSISVVTVVIIIVSIICICICIVVVLFYKWNSKRKKRMRVNSQDIEEKNEKEKEAVRKWLTNKVGLPQYYDNFIENGYFSIGRIPDIKDATELINIGIQKEADVVQLLAEIEQLRKSMFLGDEVLPQHEPGAIADDIVPQLQHVDKQDAKDDKVHDVMMVSIEGKKDQHESIVNELIDDSDERDESLYDNYGDKRSQTTEGTIKNEAKLIGILMQHNDSLDDIFNTEDVSSSSSESAFHGDLHFITTKEGLNDDGN